MARAWPGRERPGSTIEATGCGWNWPPPEAEKRCALSRCWSKGRGCRQAPSCRRNVESLTGIQAVVLTEDVWKLQVAQLVDNLSARLEVAAPAPPPPVGGPDARSRGDRQAKRPKAAWAVDGRWSFGRFFSHLTLELRSGERTHVLTLQVFEQEELTSSVSQGSTGRFCAMPQSRRHCPRQRSTLLATLSSS